MEAIFKSIQQKWKVLMCRKILKKWRVACTSNLSFIAELIKAHYETKLWAMQKVSTSRQRATKSSLTAIHKMRWLKQQCWRDSSGSADSQHYLSPHTHLRDTWQEGLNVNVGVVHLQVMISQPAGHSDCRHDACLPTHNYTIKSHTHTHKHNNLGYWFEMCFSSRKIHLWGIKWRLCSLRQ